MDCFADEASLAMTAKCVVRLMPYLIRGVFLQGDCGLLGAMLLPRNDFMRMVCIGNELS